MSINDFTPATLPGIMWPNDTARTRLTDPVTSSLAADSNENREAVQEHVLTLLAKHGPLTDADLTHRYFLDPHAPAAHHDSPRKRRSDLTRAGEVVDLGVGVSPTGRKCVVWGIPVPHPPVSAAA